MDTRSSMSIHTTQREKGCETNYSTRMMMKFYFGNKKKYSQIHTCLAPLPSLKDTYRWDFIHNSTASIHHPLKNWHWILNKEKNVGKCESEYKSGYEYTYYPTEKGCETNHSTRKRMKFYFGNKDKYSQIHTCLTPLLSLDDNIDETSFINPLQASNTHWKIRIESWIKKKKIIIELINWNACTNCK